MVKLDALIRERCAQYTVGIAGLGGLGSNVAVSLTRVGIGKLILVDFDQVEASNLNRQAYFRKHIGQNKTEAIREVIQAIDDKVELEIIHRKLNRENILPIFKDADIVVEALDHAQTKSMVIGEILRNTDKKIVAGSGIAGIGTNNNLKTRRVMKRLYICGDEEDQGDLFLSPRVNIVAHQQANTVLRLMMGLEEV